MHASHCRSCGAELRDAMADLGMQPLANRYLTRAELGGAEPRFSLRTLVCATCFLVQLDDGAGVATLASTVDADDVASSQSWRDHAQRFAERLTDRFHLGRGSLVVDIASHDGSLLRHVVARGVPALGIEPAAHLARAARRVGVPARVGIFTAAAARHLLADGCTADVIVACHALPRVPDLHDVLRGMARLLKPEGIVAMECPHLLRLVEGAQFDAIHHGQYSYFSLAALERACARHGLRVFDVEEWPADGGAIRVFLQHVTGPHRATPAVAALKAREREVGLEDLQVYRAFGARIDAVRDGLLAFLGEARRNGARVAACGTPPHGNTLLNYCGITPDLLPFTVDHDPLRHGRYLPLSRIPVYDPSVLREARPDFVLLLSWRLRDEMAAQLSWIKEWGGCFVTPLPTVTVWPAGARPAA